MVATREDAQAALGERMQELALHVGLALEDFVRDYGPKRHQLSKSSEAFIINDLIRGRLSAAYPPDASAGPRVHKKGNRFLIVDREFNIKAKKLDANLLSRNISTRAVRAFTSQQVYLPGFPEITNLHFGYQVLGEAELASARMFLTCPSGAKSNRWAIEVERASSKTPPPAEVISVNKPKRVRVRESAIATGESSKKSGTGGGSDDASGN